MTALLCEESRAIESSEERTKSACMVGCTKKPSRYYPFVIHPSCTYIAYHLFPLPLSYPSCSPDRFGLRRRHWWPPRRRGCCSAVPRASWWWACRHRPHPHPPRWAWEGRHRHWPGSAGRIPWCQESSEGCPPHPAGGWRARQSRDCGRRTGCHCDRPRGGRWSNRRCRTAGRWRGWRELPVTMTTSRQQQRRQLRQCRYQQCLRPQANETSTQNTAIGSSPLPPPPPAGRDFWPAPDSCGWPGRAPRRPRRGPCCGRWPAGPESGGGCGTGCNRGIGPAPGQQLRRQQPYLRTMVGRRPRPFPRPWRQHYQ